MVYKARPGNTTVFQRDEVQPQLTTPSLLACIVGPCFAITEATKNGVLNGDTLLRTPARLRSTSPLGEFLAVSAKYLALRVDEGSVQVVRIPTAPSGDNLRRTFVLENIKRQLVGVTVELDSDDYLVITSNTRGSGSSLTVVSRASLLDADYPGITDATNMAHSALYINSFEDETLNGADGYDNSQLVIAFNQFPTYEFHPGADELRFDTDEIRVLSSLNGTTRQLSTDRAINWNSYLVSTDRINNTAVAHSGPITSSRRSLYALRTAGVNTDRLIELGSDASTKIVCPTLLGLGDSYPDTSNSYYLFVEAKGSQDFRLNQASPIGAYAGSAGNSISVLFTNNNGSGEVTASWNAGSSLLTITYDNDSTTWADLEACLDNLTGRSSIFHTLSVVYPSTESEELFDADAEMDTIRTYLSGGKNPVNFGTGYTEGTNAAAVIVGSVRVNDAQVARLQGKRLRVRVDNYPWQEVVIPSTSAALVTALSALDGVTATTTTVYSRYQPGTSTTALKLTADASAPYIGHCSTLEIDGDVGVVEGLFSGSATISETLTNGSGVGPVTATLASGTDFNKNAVGNLELGLIPGNIRLTLGGVKLVAFAVSRTALTNSTSYTIKMSHSGFRPSGGALGDSFSVTFSSGANLSAAVGNLNTALAAVSGEGVTPAANSFIRAQSTIINANGSTAYLCIYDYSATPGAKFRLITTDTTPAFKTLFNGDGSAFDVDLVTTVGSVVLTDTPEGTIPLSATPSTTFPAPVGFSILDEGSAGDNIVNYAIGEILYKLRLSSATSWTQTLSASKAAASLVSVQQYPYSGVSWSARSSKVVSGDRLFNSGAPVGQIVKTEDSSIAGAPSGWGTGNVIVLQSNKVASGTIMANWYITAENLNGSTGRAVPEIVMSELNQSLTIRCDLNRDTAGIPVASALAKLYVSFKALRLDVCSAILQFNGLQEVDQQIGPIVPENPLAWALFAAFLNAPSVKVAAIGVDEISELEAMGTTDAYARALTVVAKNSLVYNIAVLSQNYALGPVLKAHAEALSDGINGKKERVMFFCPKQPSEVSPLVCVTSAGVTLESIGGDVYQFTFPSDVNVPSTINGKEDANGDEIVATSGTTLTATQGVFLRVSGDHRRYLVTRIVSNRVIEVDLNVAFYEDSGPGTGGNDDGYYDVINTGLANYDVEGEEVTIYVRQYAVDVSTTSGRLEVMNALAAMGEGINSRRVVLVQPPNVVMQNNGSDISVSGSFLAAAIAAMSAVRSPKTGLTNAPMVGFVSPVGSSDTFSEEELGIAAGGGVYWVIQDEDGAPLICRHQLTTAIGSPETEELSVTRARDFFSRALRTGVRNVINGRELDSRFMNTTVNTTVQSIVSSMIGTVVESASVTGLAISTTDRSRIIVQVRATFFLPLNGIDFQIST